MPAWLIRVASRPQDGGGHVARCHALAEALDRTAPVVFALDAGGHPHEPVLAGSGFTVVRGPTPAARRWFGSVIDGYAYTADDAAALHAIAAPLTALDDFLDPPSAADMVVNGAPHLSGDRVNSIPALLGARYALVNRRFAALPDRAIGSEVATVLIALGRADPDNATALALDALAVTRVAPQVRVALGSDAPHLDAVRAGVAALGARASLVLDGDMAELLAGVDLVVGAGGVGLIERLAAGLPSVTVATADNQRLQAAGAGEHDATVFAGAVGDLDAGSLAAVIDCVASDPGRRRTIARRARELVDGQGAARVAAAMTDLAYRHHRMRAAATGARR